MARTPESLYAEAPRVMMASAPKELRGSADNPILPIGLIRRKRLVEHGTCQFGTPLEDN